MKILLSVILVGIVVVCQSCATGKLWEDTDPNERIWLDASKTTEEALQKRGVDYEVYDRGGRKGYLIKKSGMDRMKDYHLRVLGTPVTLVLDAATAVVVVGAYMFVNDPDGTVWLIQELAH
jgi:hypothetical protein